MTGLQQMLSDYLQLRRSLGHELAEAGWLLPDFVRYLDEHQAPTVTIAVALGWAQGPVGRSAVASGIVVRSRRSRLTPCRPASCMTRSTVHLATGVPSTSTFSRRSWW